MSKEWDEEDWYTDFELWCLEHPELGDEMGVLIDAYYASFPRTEALEAQS